MSGHCPSQVSLYGLVIRLFGRWSHLANGRHVTFVFSCQLDAIDQVYHVQSVWAVKVSVGCIE